MNTLGCVIIRDHLTVPPAFYQWHSLLYVSLSLSSILYVGTQVLYSTTTPYMNLVLLWGINSTSCFVHISSYILLRHSSNDLFSHLWYVDLICIHIIIIILIYTSRICSVLDRQLCFPFSEHGYVCLRYEFCFYFLLQLFDGDKILCSPSRYFEWLVFYILNLFRPLDPFLASYIRGNLLQHLFPLIFMICS